MSSAREPSSDGPSDKYLTSDDSSRGQSTSLAELSLLFLRLGATSFGGPAAHISLMHDEVVKRRAWLDDQQFLDLIGATNLIPGPNSTEMAIHIGYMRAGWRGMLLGGLCFMIPAATAVLILSWAYVRFGSTPEAGWLLYGVKPVVIAIILQALWSLGRKAISSAFALAVAVAVIVLYFLGINEIALLFAGGAIVMIGRNLPRLWTRAQSLLLLPFGGVMAMATIATPFSQLGLFLHMLKIGAVWYGSGYVLLAFFRADFVARFGWINDQQLIDAIAVSQITPGPLFTAATFIGYLLDGFTGAALATVAICLPSFVFVALSNPLIPRIRKSRVAGSVLDGVNISALGLMAAVSWQLGRASVIDPATAIIASGAFLLLVRYRVKSIWLIGGGALTGLVKAFL
jgi:chromate transporter